MIQKLLNEIEAVLPSVRWERADGPSDHDARFFHGTASGWNFTLCSFDVAYQGFPEGTRGYDGAAASGKAIVRLTRELAEQAIKLAEAQHDVLEGRA